MISLLQQVFLVPDSVDQLVDAASTMSHVAASDVLSAMVGINNDMNVLRVHSKQAFAVGPLAVGKAIASIVRKTFIKVQQQQQQQQQQSSHGSTDIHGSNVATPLSVEAQTLEQELTAIDTDLIQVEAAIAHVTTSTATTSSGGQVQEPTLSSVLDLRELEADRFGMHLKYIDSAKQLRNVTSTLKQSLTIALATHKPQMSSRLLSLPDTPSRQGSGGYADLLVHGLLSDCGETQASLVVKTTGKSNISAQVESLQLERQGHIQPLHQRLEGYSSRVGQLMERHAALTAELNDISTEMNQIEGMKIQTLRNIEDADKLFQSKISKLEAANHVSLAAYQVKDSVHLYLLLLAYY